MADDRQDDGGGQIDQWRRIDKIYSGGQIRQWRRIDRIIAEDKKDNSGGYIG